MCGFTVNSGVRINIAYIELLLFADSCFLNSSIHFKLRGQMNGSDILKWHSIKKMIARMLN